MKMHLLVLISCGALLGVTASPAPPRLTLEGQVVDLVFGEPVQGAQVALVAAGRAVLSDPDGRFSFGSVELRGAERLRITHQDYRAIEIPLGSPADASWLLRIAIGREPQRMGPPPEGDDRR